MTSFSLEPGQNVNLSIMMDGDGVHVNLRVEGASVDLPADTQFGEIELVGDSGHGGLYVSGVQQVVPPKPPVNARPAATPSGHRVDKMGRPIVSPASHVSAAEWLQETQELSRYSASFKSLALSLGQHAGHIARAENIEPKWTGSLPGRGDRLYPREVWAGAWDRRTA